jgi:type III secretion protein Q
LTSSRATTEFKSLRGQLKPISESAQVLSVQLFKKPWRISLAGDTPTQLSLQFGTQHVPEEWVQLRGNAYSVYWSPQVEPLSVTVEDRTWFDYSGAARLLAFGLAHETRIAQFSELVGEALLPAQLHTGAHFSVAGGVRLQYQLHQQDICVGKGWVVLSSEIIHRLLERAQYSAAATQADWPEHWLELAHTQCSAQLAPLMLSLEELASVRAGDVIGLGARTAAVANMTVSMPGFGAWRCRTVPTGWRIVRAADPQDCVEVEESPMEAENVQSENDNPIAERVQVRLGFEVGRKKINIADLAAIQPGYVFRLPAPLEGQNVTLLANGREIATGELVSVGDFLGVRVLEVRT